MKKPGTLLCFHSFPVFAWLYTNSAYLLSLDPELFRHVVFGLLEHFWTTRRESDELLHSQGCCQDGTFLMRTRPACEKRLPIDNKEQRFFGPLLTRLRLTVTFNRYTDVDLA